MPNAVIKQAHWKSNFFPFSEELNNITESIFWQSDDAYISTDSDFLFEIICQNFFYNYPDVKFNIERQGSLGMYYPEIYQILVYNLIYENLTREKIENNIKYIEDEEQLFYTSKLEAQMIEHKKRILAIIETLKIDFKQESKRLHRILYDINDKEGFYIDDKVY
jgi:hypothetical protein